MTDRSHPPSDINTRQPRVATIQDVTFYRFYSRGNNPIFFDRSSCGRLNSPDGSFGVLYAAEQTNGAFAPGETSSRETSSRETSSRETSPPVASPPIVGRPPLWATKTTGCNVALSAVAPFVAPRAVAPSVARSALSNQLPNAIDLRLIRLVEGADIPAIGWTQKKTSTEAVDSILPHLPGPISELRGRSLERHYQKARDALPPEYGYWVFLVRRWGDREWDSNLDGPRDEVDAFIEIVGPRGGRDGIAELFDHLARQWAQGRQKLAWLRKYRERINANPRYWPQLKPMRTTGSDAEAAAVVALICANLKTEWTVSLLAKRRRRGIYYMDHLTTEMRFREMLVMVDEGVGAYYLCQGGAYKSKRLSLSASSKI